MSSLFLIISWNVKIKLTGLNCAMMEVDKISQKRRPRKTWWKVLGVYQKTWTVPEVAQHQNKWRSKVLQLSNWLTQVHLDNGR